MLSCEEAVHICNKGQYGESTAWEKFLHKIHLVICKACKAYSANNTKLTNMIKKAKISCLDKKFKDKMKQEFNIILKKQSS